MFSSAYRPKRQVFGAIPERGIDGSIVGGSDEAVGQGWTLNDPGDDVKDILTRQRSGQRLSDEDWQRLNSRVGAENETIRRGGRVNNGIQPRRLTPVEMGQRDREAVAQDERDLNEYSAGRGFPVRKAGPTREQLAARQNGVNRASSGGWMERGGKLHVFSGKPVANPSQQLATSGGTITTGDGQVRRYAGTPVKSAPASSIATPAAPKSTVPLSDDADEVDDVDEVASTPRKKVRRDILAA